MFLDLLLLWYGNNTIGCLKFLVHAQIEKKSISPSFFFIILFQKILKDSVYCLEINYISKNS